MGTFIKRRTMLGMLAAGSISSLSVAAQKRKIETEAIENKTVSEPNSQDETLAFKVPSEAGRHKQTWMQWPVSRRIHRNAVFLDELQGSIAKIASTISEFEPVTMMADPKYHRAMRSRLSSNVNLLGIKTDDLWCRDSGPLFVKNSRGDLAVRNLNFNGWGNKQIHPNDGSIAQKVAQTLKIPFLESDVVGEPGGVEFNGHDTLIAHESSWINPNRNNDPRASIEQKLLRAYGAEKMIWAPGLKGRDITDYHIDSLVRFVDKETVLIQLPDHDLKAHDPFAWAAYQTLEVLKNAQTANAGKFKIIKINDPKKMRVRNAEFVASYVNYYQCNGAVIVSQFGDREQDKWVERRFTELFPDREVVMVNADNLGWIGGGIHCATQQQPA